MGSSLCRGGPPARMLLSMRCARTVLFLGCLGWMGCADPVNGELYIEQEHGRALVFAPNDCADGEPLGYFGVEMKDDRGRILEFFRDGEEPALVYFSRGGDAFELGPAQCEHFEGSITRKYNRVTNNGRVHGDLSIECTMLDGRRVEGSLSFEKCDQYDEDEEHDCDDDDWWNDDW